LSKIKLTETELETFTKDMQVIMDSVKTLVCFDTDLKNRNLPETPFESLRDDIARDSISNADALANVHTKKKDLQSIRRSIR
jgi:aspartyl/glutamyl-tRNA(Asn/Gln) amidotransferase C subunit